MLLNPRRQYDASRKSETGQVRVERRSGWRGGGETREEEKSIKRRWEGKPSWKWDGWSIREVEVEAGRLIRERGE